MVYRDSETQRKQLDKNSHNHRWIQSSPTNSMGLVKKKSHTKTMITSACFRAYAGTHNYFILSRQLTTFINGGAFCYSFEFILIRPTRLTLV